MESDWMLSLSNCDGFIYVADYSAVHRIGPQREVTIIAKIRGSADGTIKAHLNNIYRKSNTRNRAEVLSSIMDAMLDKPLLPKDP